MNESKRPIPESYWVIPGRFLAGEYPGQYDRERTRQRIDRFLEAGITTFIDLTAPNENVPYAPILREEAKIYEVQANYHNIPITDFRTPPVETMRKILTIIDDSLNTGENIYVHCWAGIGRTGTTVGCHLVQNGMTGEQALQQLKTWWHGVPKSSVHTHTPETPSQRAFILAWAQYKNER